MTSVRSPDAAFAALMKAARADASHAGRTVTITETKRALEALSGLPETERAAVVDKFLAGSAKGALSPAARDLLVDVAGLLAQQTPSKRFDRAISDAMAHGKVKGQITKGEVERALKELDALPPEDAVKAARALLSSPGGTHLSAGAKKLVHAFVDAKDTEALAGAARRIVKSASDPSVQRAFESAFGRPMGTKRDTIAQLMKELQHVKPQSTAG